MATVKIKGIEELTKKFNNIANANIKESIIKATNIVHGQAKLLAPVDKGNLRGSIHQEVKQNGVNYVGRVYTNLQYAPFVEFGTGIKGRGTYPYKIKGINLTYSNKTWTYSPDGGETFYKTNGQIAQPFMYPALKKNEKYIKKLINESVNSEIKGGK